MDNMSEPTRRTVLAATATAAAFGLAASAAPGAAAPARSDTTEGDNAIRPFHIDVAEDALVDLRRRIAATRWPEKETAADQSRRAARDDSGTRAIGRQIATGASARKN